MALHRPFPLSEREMTVLSSIVEAFVRPMIQTRRDLSLCGTIRAEFVRDDPLGNETKTLDQAAQQPFCRPFVPPGLEGFVQHDAMLINRTPKPILAPRDSQGNFIQMPDITWTVQSLPQISSYSRSELDDPTPDSFVRSIDSAL